MNIEIGKKYITRTVNITKDWAVEFVEIVGIHGNNLAYQGKIYYKKDMNCPVDSLWYLDGNNLYAPDFDLVSEYKEQTEIKKEGKQVTNCKHKKVNVSFNEANPVWACAHCGKDWDKCEEDNDKVINLYANWAGLSD